MGRSIYTGIFFLLVCATTGVTPAQTISSAAAPTPHAAALRQQLGLSENLQLEWITSSNGTDTLRVTDNFNRSSIGSDWALDERYWAIRDGELVLTSAAIYEWRYLAVFKPVFNTPERQIYSVAYRWGRNADAVGIGEGAHALMITEASEYGSGYWCWRRTNQNSVWLYAIKDGTWEYTPGESKEYHRSYARLPIPQAGDYIEVEVYDRPDAVYFDYYINGNWDATVKDVSKEFAQNPTWYAGVFIHGQDLHNEVDDFTITWLAGDEVAPATVEDLRAIDSTSTSVTLEWTSPGDNEFEGFADRLVIRYSQNPITPGNFASAQLAQNIPAPSAGGETQQFIVAGLEPSTQYYFALRAFDEVNNASAVSNVVASRTRASGAGVAESMHLLSACGQTGIVGTALPVAIKVVDPEGFGVPDYPVDFAVTAGGGGIDGESERSLLTDGEGIAEVMWTLGTTVGENRIEIIATDLQNSPQRCSVTAAAGPAKQFLPISGNQQLLSPNAISEPLAVRLADEFGNGINNATVTFIVTAGEGKFVDATTANGKRFKTNTNGEGQASARLQAGKNYGDSTAVSVVMDGNNEVPAAALVLRTTVPDSMLLVAGDQQSGPIGQPLLQPLVVKIVDQLGAPVPRHGVTFKVIAGNGTLPGGVNVKEVFTDSSGRASIAWTVGLGLNQLEASAAGLQGSPLVFTATGTDPTSAVAEQGGVLPLQFALLPNAPNPFNPSTTIHFELPQSAEVALEIFDLSGRQVRRLFEGMLGAGAHRLLWDGRDEWRRALDSGVYFCRLRARAAGTNELHVATRKLTLAR